MKKVHSYLSLLLVAAMLCLLFSACGATSPQPAGTSGSENPNAAESTAPESPSSTAITTNSDAFDSFARPAVKTDGKLTVAYIHQKPTVESQSRSIYQAGIEAAHRGWTLLDMNFNNDSEWPDLMKSAINQGVDAIILGSTETMDAKTDLIAQARNAGIGVYCNDNQVVSGVIMNSTMPNGSAAMDLIYKIMDDYNYTANVGIITVGNVQVHIERTDPIAAVCGVYSNMKVVDKFDLSSYSGDPQTGAYDAATSWFQKYGTDLTGVIASCDFVGMPAAEAAQAAGASVNPNFFVAGIDGGSSAWSYIRQGGYYKYCYSQPFELFTHKVFEVIDQLQAKGLNPGDVGCDITHAGQTLYSVGKVVTLDNCPKVGESIHSAFSYYDPSDTAAWYNWTDNGGAYVITE